MDNGHGVRFTCSKPYVASDFAMVKIIGDVNGDNLADFAVSFYQQDSSSVEGIVAIIYGSAQLQNNLDVCSFTDQSVGFRIRGSQGSKFGFKVVDMGDLNGDGVTDLAISAPAYSGPSGTITATGRVYVVYLPTINGRKLEYSIAQLKTYTLTSGYTAVVSALGTYLADPVDFNGDGVKDVMIGNTGATADPNVYILFGQQSTTGDTITTNLQPNFGAAFTSNNGAGTADTGFGRLGLASCGDLNSDGVMDYVVPGTTFFNIIWGMGKNPTQVLNTVSTVVSTATVPGLSNLGETISYGTGLTFTGGLTCADMDQDGISDVVFQGTNTNGPAATTVVSVYILYGNSIRNFAQTTIIGMQQYLGVNVYQVVGSTTFGANIKRGTGWNGYGQDFILISDTAKSVIYALYSSQMFGSTPAPISFIIDNIAVGTGTRIYTSDTSYKVGSSLDSMRDINYDGIVDVLTSEGITYNTYAYYGQCNSATGCACPYGYRFKNGYCQGYWLSGGQKTGIIVGVVIGAMLLIALGVFVMKKTACGQKCFESYSKPAAFGSHTHNPIPQTMATSA